MAYITNKRNGIENGVSLQDKTIRVWESEDNPHGVNNETCCTVSEFVEGSENGIRVSKLIESGLGKKTLDQIRELAKVVYSA